MKIHILLFSLLALNFLHSQSDKFKIEIDYSRFYYNDTSGYFELYYSFYQDQLKKQMVNGKYLEKGILEIQIIDLKSNAYFVNKNWAFSREINEETSNTEQKSLTGVLGFQLPFGNYKCAAKGKDYFDLTHQDSISFDFEIEKFANDRFAISDLQLASQIRQLEEQSSSIFYKNTYEVIPNPSMIFGETLPVVYFYSEIYNVSKDIQSEVLMIEHVLLSSLNKPYYKKVKYIPRKNNSIVEVAAINISRIPSGSYTLVLSVSDTLKNLRVTSSKRVFIYNPNVLDTTLSKFSELDVLSSEFSVMTEEELNETYNISKYLATNDENEQWKKINTIDGKRNFLFKFWKMRDPDQLSPQNEAKIEYFKRVEISNLQFSNVQKRGWKTDRGRIYLLYGEPSEIERYPNQVDAKPYEIWKYNNLEGGVIFVFADLTGFADYTLLHSTLRGELRDDNWMRKINVR